MQEESHCGAAAGRSESAAALPSGPEQELLPGGAEPAESFSGGAEDGGSASALPALSSARATYTR